MLCLPVLILKSFRISITLGAILIKDRMMAKIGVRSEERVWQSTQQTAADILLAAGLSA